MRLAVIVIGAVIGAWPRLAHADAPADPASVALETESTRDARGCADGSVLRARIAERLGRDPFTSAGPKSNGTIRVSFARDKVRAWTAEISLFDSNEKRVGARSLSHGGSTCEALVGSVVLTIAVLLEDLEPPTAAPAPAPPPAAPAAPEPTRDEPPSTPSSLVAPTPRSARFDLALGGAGALGGAPAASMGGELGGGIDLARFRVEIGGRMYLPTSSGGDVAVRTRLVHGRLAPCWGWTTLAGCVVAAIGSISGEASGGGVTGARLESQFYAAGGVALLSRWFFVDDLLFVRATVDFLFAATRAGFDVGDRRVWTVPVVSGAGALALGVRLP